MSLSEAVLMIADRMEEDSGEVTDSVLARQIRGYARELRTVVKATEGSPSFVAERQDSMEAYRKMEAERMRRQAEEQLRIDERGGGMMIEFVGGPLDGVFLPFDHQPPVGAKTIQGGALYQLDGSGRFHVAEEKKGG